MPYIHGLEWNTGMPTQPVEKYGGAVGQLIADPALDEKRLEEMTKRQFRQNAIPGSLTSAYHQAAGDRIDGNAPNGSGVAQTFGAGNDT